MGPLKKSVINSFIFEDYSVSEFLSMNPYDILFEILTKEQISIFGWTLLQQPLSLSLYSEWLEQKHQGSMTYLQEHFNTKAMLYQNDIAKSAIVIGIPYLPHPETWPSDPIPNLQRAAYSKGVDYHFWLKAKLHSIIESLQPYFPGESFQAWVDSGPVLEKDLAYRSGLGWIGKNTCLINKKKGSFFLIGEIYTSLNIENKNPLSADFCGKCNRCVEACPTGAINSNRVLEATKCISYWTIECKDIPSKELRNNFRDWIFGCDICQNVCPWNIKVQSPVKSNKLNAKTFEDELKWILLSSNNEIQRALSDSALARASGYKLKRNALIVIANLKLNNLSNEVSAYLNNPRLSELAKWCLEKINCL
jgi:epoxyqueuosine reductase